ncbi:metal-dependent hydrolase family protein [Janthinobacterium sp. RA13]|uniref:metal-dependent hydrolase family protein n=1 Tax=Janthinobacterium sp. RA13 TaxID=1502762 RepID=UPI000AC624DA|nr:amidohydrolase family protein [Janthinobacterium sp. RA13]
MALAQEQHLMDTWQTGGLKARACDCGGTVFTILHQRVMADMRRRQFLGGAAAMLAPFIGLSTSSAIAQQPQTSQRPLLLTNLRLFDGTGKAPRSGIHVLVTGPTITALLPAGEKVEGAQVIDCQGKLVMPGLIDAHWHTMLAAINQVTAMTSDVGYLYLVAAQEAQRTLLRGFTSVRDPGGPAFALKRAIDEGIVDGPRIFPSGAMISQTSGHGDFRLRSEIPRAANAPLGMAETAGMAMIADGEAEVLRRVREQLMLGATQIKMMAGGGVASMYDPLDSTQYSERELRAGVEAAADWGTYVMTHVYTPKGIQRAIRAGVRSIEHGQLADDESVRLMRDTGTWWSLQPFLMDADANVYPDAVRKASQAIVSEGTVKAYALAQKYGIRTGWGTDILFSPKNTPTQGRQLAKLTRFYDPLTLLAQATGQNGELLALSGQRSPYPGTLGKLAVGAFADLLVADGDPTKNLDFLAQPEENLLLIMKNGRIYKDKLSAPLAG